MRDKIPGNVIEIIQKLKDNKHQAFIVGGCVRDLLLDKRPKDWDIATSATPNEVEQIFSDWKTIAVGKSFGVIVVIDDLTKEQFEIATFRKDGEYDKNRHPKSVEFCSVEEDSNRRDFTFNAMYFDPLKNKLLDFHNGKEDLLKAEKVKFIGNANERIKEDPLRILRAIRFSSKYGMRLSDEAFLAIKEKRYILSRISKERIQDELTKILMIGNFDNTFRLFERTMVLRILLPAVHKLALYPQDINWHPEGDCWQHTIRSLDKLPKLALNNKIVLWATLLHDIGKPNTFENHGNGKIANHNHDMIGAEIANEILRDLKFSNKEREAIVWIIENHMRVKHAHELKLSKFKRLIAHKQFNNLMVVSRADSESSICKTSWCNKVMKRARKIVNGALIDFTDAISSKSKFVSGLDLIRLGLKPGPNFKIILDKVLEAELNEEIKTKEEAIELVKKFLI